MLTCPNRTGKRLGRIGGRRFAIISALFILLVSAVAGALTPEEEALQAKQTAKRQKANWQTIYPLIQSADLSRHVTYLESLGSRVAGYPGNAAAADYIARQFREIGLKDVSRPLKSELSGPPQPYREEFKVTVPVVHSASLQLSGGSEKVRLYPLWPNLVRTSQFPKGGVDLPLIYGGKGKLTEFKGQEVEGRAVLLDFASEESWLNPVRLGAKAIIFIAPPATPQQNFRAEAENKFLSIPVDIPRFWISREAAAPLLAQLKSPANPIAHLECDMVWERRPSWNLIGEIPGADPKLRSEVIYLEAYYDSMSVAPELAPGAESAGGIATLLEIARVMKQHPPARTVRFLATGTHFVSLTGVRSYLGQHFEELHQGQAYTRPAKFLGLIPYRKTYYKKQAIHLFCALDLSSHTDQVGGFYKGRFYDINDRVYKRELEQIGTFFQETALALAKLIPQTNGHFSDAINEITNTIDPQGVVNAATSPWRSLMIGGGIASDAEPITIGGSKGIGFITCNDSRPRVDTPFDRSEAMNFANLAAQARLLACLLQETAAAPNAPLKERLVFDRANLVGGFGRVSGRSLIFDAKSGIVPNKSIPGSLVIMRGPIASLTGVRANIVELVDPRGGYDIEGVANVITYGDREEWRMVHLESYHLDPNTGSVDHARDLGSSQGQSYPTSFYMISGEVERPIIIFSCVSLTVFDLIDPQNLSSLYVMTVLDGETDAEPRSYSFSRPRVESKVIEASAPRLENVGMVFAQKDTRIKLLVSAGAGAIRMVLLNAATVNKDHPSGLGYKADYSKAILNTALAAAQDMRALDAMRIAKFERFHIVNKNIKQMHAQAKKYIIQAEQDLKDKDYAAMEANAFAGWGYESKAYPTVQATNDDVVKAVIFYLALMLPFAFFIERLVLAARDFSRQIMGFLVIFILTVLIFSRIHPAFRISPNPLIVPLAFIMLSLSLLVISIVMSKFEAQLRALREQMGGVHRADIGRMGVAAAAFNLGISNMRKRKARTLFTCLTLVALTFTVLSFTSVTSSTRFTVRAEKGKPRYQGIMLRDSAWAKIESSAYQILRDQFGSQHPVAPRAWYFSTRSQADPPEEPSVTLSSENLPTRHLIKGLAGMTPEENRVTRFDRALTSGRWFQPGEKFACIVPDAVAKVFHLGPADLGRAQLNIGGIPFTVIGILNSPRATAIKDLDQEPLSPADFVSMTLNKGGAAQAFRQFQHLSWETVVIIPFSAALDFGAPIQSIAIGFPNGKQVETALMEMLPRLNFNLYAGQGKFIRRWSALSSTSLGGVQDLVVPILIVALIILNTMLGSVYERVKEIHIYSSIGLGPNHIGVLFIAEAFVYAVLGAIFGYLVGQSFAMIITRYSPGLELNYSSLSAVASTSIVIAVVLLSALYPARKASQVATPAVDRHWQLPEPVGDAWEIRLPFAVTGAQATAMNAFLMEWFQAFEGHSIGDFVTENVQFCEETGSHGKGYCLRMMTWLAPFDLGVSQRAELRTLATDMEDVFEIKFTLYRESGDVTSWKRVNRTFLNTIRKQFLIWRALSAKDRDRYLGLSEPAKPRGETAA